MYWVVAKSTSDERPSDCFGPYKSKQDAHLEYLRLVDLWGRDNDWYIIRVVKEVEA